MPDAGHFKLYGIKIIMYGNDHLPKHFHIRYGEYLGIMNIDTLVTYEGWVPARVEKLVREWAAQNQDSLLKSWEMLRMGQLPPKIKPLD